MSASPIYGTVAAWNWFRGQMLASPVAAVRADGRVSFTAAGAGAAPADGSTTAHGATTR